MGGAYIVHFAMYAALDNRTDGKKRPCVRHPDAHETRTLTARSVSYQTPQLEISSFPNLDLSPQTERASRPFHGSANRLITGNIRMCRGHCRSLRSHGPDCTSTYRWPKSTK